MPATRGAGLEVQRFRCKKFFNAKLSGNDLLIHSELDESLNGLPVSPISIADPEWKWVSDDFLECDSTFVGWRQIVASI
jgi:hypothetical protein